MNSLVLLTVVALAGFVAAETYTNRYDSINIDEILANKNILISYIKCVLEQGKCTPEGKELKVHVQDGMQTGCSKCTDKQRQNSRKVVKHLKEKEPEFFKQLLEKFDPESKYKPTYEAFLARDD